MKRSATRINTAFKTALVGLGTFSFMVYTSNTALQIALAGHPFHGVLFGLAGIVLGNVVMIIGLKKIVEKESGR